MGARISTTLFIPTSGSTTRVEPVGYTPATGFQDVVIRNAYTKTAVGLGNAATFGWSSTTDPSAAADTQFKRDGAGIVGVYGAGSTYGRLRIADGASATPALAYGSDATTGFYKPQAGHTDYVSGDAAGAHLRVHPTLTNPTAAATAQVYNRDNGSGTPLGGVVIYSLPPAYISGAFFKASYGYLVSDGNMDALVLGTTAASKVLYFGTEATLQTKLSTNILSLQSGISINWSSTTSPDGSADLGLARQGSNALKITDGASSVSNVFAGAYNSTVTNQSTVASTVTWSDGGTYNALSVALTDTSSAAGSRLIKATVGGVSVFEVTKTGGVYYRAPQTTKTADYTVLSTDSGTAFDDTGAGAVAVRFTLPSAATAGLVLTFIHSNTTGGSSMILDAAGTDFITINGSSSTAGGTATASGSAGHIVTLISAAGRWWGQTASTWTLA